MQVRFMQYPNTIPHSWSEHPMISLFLLVLSTAQTRDSELALTGQERCLSTYLVLLSYGCLHNTLLVEELKLG